MIDANKGCPEKLVTITPEKKPSDCFVYNVMSERLDTHIHQYHLDKEGESAKWEALLDAQQNNTASINSLVESTKGLVDAWQAANGVVKLGAAIGSFAKWVGGIAVLGTLFTFMADKVK